MASYLLDIKKCVAFVFIKDQKTSQLIPQGTGFLLGVKDIKDPNNAKGYFVTAKHVLFDDNKQAYFDEIFIRFNQKNGDSTIVQFKLSEHRIICHTDPDVDIALFPLALPQDKFDFKIIMDDLISTPQIIKEHNICEGDDVFFTGLFVSHIGQKRNQPIVRFGKVALMSEEKVEWKEKNKPPKFLDLYLLECQSYGGNSGAPVFFSLSQIRQPGVISTGGPSFFLAGIMRGSFLNGSDVVEAKQIETANRFLAYQNIGIAAVTPAYKLSEILDTLN